MRRDRRVLVGADARQIALVTRLLPVSYWWLVSIRANRLMRGKVGGIALPAGRS